MGTRSRSSLTGLLFLTLVFVFGSRYEAVSFSFTSSHLSLNCSALCKCHQQTIQQVLQQHLQRHRDFMGSKYRDEKEYKSTYIDFVGIYAVMVNQMVEIKCSLQDKRKYAVSTLLNGIDQLRYVTLEVNCFHGEEILWDIPSWQVSMNVFVGNRCRIVPVEEAKGVIIPMNMWIFEADHCGESLLSQLDIRYTMNTIALSVTGSDTNEIPLKWKGDYMLSATNIRLKANKLTHYSCQMVFTKDVDTINLEENSITQFPECVLFEQRTGIKFLSMSHNKINDISPLFNHKKWAIPIQMIDLSYNAINKIGTFRPMKTLTVLDLSHNQIEEINDDAFQNLIDLKFLNLQNNRIHYVGSVAFRNNIDLIELSLNTNYIKHLRYEQFPSAESKISMQLDVRRNKFHFPPFFNCADNNVLLKNIQVSSAANQYHCNCDLIKLQECVNFLGNKSLNGSMSKVNEVYVDIQHMKCASPQENKGRLVHELSFISSCVLENNCPQSCSCHLLNKTTVDIDCTGRRLLELPDTIPTYPNASSRLFLSHNPLQLLSYRPYLTNLSELHVDNCLLSSVTPMALAALQNVKVLTLHNNLIQKLPSTMKNITLKKANNITLHNNRWSCSCDNLWLPKWITRHKAILWTPGNIVCNYLKKPVAEFSSKDINCSSYSQSEMAVAITLAILSILSSLFLFVNYGQDLSLLVYSKVGVRLNSHFSYGDQFNPYDVYVSYGEDNYKWVVDMLAPRLEEGPKKYKLCLHYRDFPSDDSIMENIPWAIKLSRVSLLILSKAFMKKEWCIMDLRAIFQRLLMVSNRLIIIVTDDLTPDDVSPDLRAYMNTHKYFQVDDVHFWDKLDMVLPPKDATDRESDQGFDHSPNGSGDAAPKEEESPDSLTELISSWQTEKMDKD